MSDLFKQRIMDRLTEMAVNYEIRASEEEIKSNANMQQVAEFKRLSGVLSALRLEVDGMDIGDGSEEGVGVEDGTPIVFPDWAQVNEHPELLPGESESPSEAPDNPEALVELVEIVDNTGKDGEGEAIKVEDMGTPQGTEVQPTEPAVEVTNPTEQPQIQPPESGSLPTTGTVTQPGVPDMKPLDIGKGKRSK